MEDRPSEAPTMADSKEEDVPLAKSKVLTRPEVLKRRIRLLKRLIKYYRDYYWLLIKVLRQKHREYYWVNGKGPFIERKEEDDEVLGTENVNLQNNFDNNNNVGSDGKLGLGLSSSNSISWCVYPSCKEKAMALTKYCILHILLDNKQVLYKGCMFPLQRRGSGEIGSLICGRAILKSTHPSICRVHIVQAKKEVNQALRKAGASVTAASKVSSKFNFHLVINEYVHLIQQSRRRATATSARRTIGRIVAGNGGT